MQTACLIIIGNEILSGRTQDKNLSWLAKELNECGVRLLETRVIPDIRDTIIATVNECRAKFTYVFTTGGIGPTHDDITSECIASAFGAPYERNAQAAAILEKHYGDQINEARLKMAGMPKGARLILNPVSAAPGFHIGNVYVMAGVPSIMQAMFAHIRHDFKGGAKMLAKTISAYTTEGVIAEKLTAIQHRHANVEIGSYPFMRNGRLGVSLVSRAADAQALAACYGEIKAMLLGFTADVHEDDLAA